MLDVERRFRVKAVVGEGYFHFSSVIKELSKETLALFLRVS